MKKHVLLPVALFLSIGFLLYFTFSSVEAQNYFKYFDYESIHKYFEGKYIRSTNAIFVIGNLMFINIEAQYGS